MILILEDAGFGLQIHTELTFPRPFQEFMELNEKGLRLEILCFREEAKPKRIQL